MSPLSLARRHQLHSGPEDDRLLLVARTHHPRARHWWGRRTTETGAGAHCYLCDDIIAAWSSRWPITERA